MNSCELTSAITALANLITENYDDNELALLATILTQLGDTIGTILANKNFCDKNK